jgi:hypothetical protein
MSTKHSFFKFALAVLASAGGFASNLVVPPQGNSSAQVTGSNPDFYDVVDPFHVSINGGVASAQLGPEPAVLVSGASGGSDVQNASAQVTWYVEFTGYAASNNPPPIPVIILGVATAGASGSGGAGAGVENGILGFPQFDTGDLSCGTGGVLPACTSYQITLELTPGFDNFIIISAAGSGGTTGGTYNAVNDPTIEIDPTYAAAHPGVQLIESPNVGNGTASTPEPASLFLIGAGLLIIYSARTLWTNCTAIDPSPTAAATRFMLPDRTSPTAKTPGKLVSSK